MNIYPALVVIMLVVLAGCSSREPVVQERGEVNIVTATAERRDVVDAVQTSGTVEPKREAVLSARIMGAITLMNADEGDRVRKGETLVVIDASEIRARKSEAGHARDEGLAALREAEAARENAAINYSRMKALYDEEAVSKKELDDMTTQNAMAGARAEQVRARIAQAEAAIKQADVMLGYTVITAPINGVVVMKSAHVGETAAPGVPLLKIIDDGALRLVTDVKESGLAGLRSGDRVMVTVDALPGAELAGTVSEIVPAADPATRSFTVKVDLPAKAGLLPGMYGVAHLPAGKRSAVVLPAGSLVDREGISGVYVVGADKMIRFQAVRLGEKLDGGREALSGLNGGESVATGELSGVREGMRALVK